MLSDDFIDALAFAADVHRTQTRKGGDIPYLGHLLSVAGLVIEAGGSEAQAAAALLHDAAEDQGGVEMLSRIEAAFGPEVAGIVSECSDTFETPKPPWRLRKQTYVEHLGSASDGALLVSMADKLDNARAMLRDLRSVGPVLWQRFSVSDPSEHMWYYRSLLAVYESRSSSWLVDELRRVLDDMDQLISASRAD